MCEVKNILKVILVLNIKVINDHLPFKAEIAKRVVIKNYKKFKILLQYYCLKKNLSKYKNKLNKYK